MWDTDEPGRLVARSDDTENLSYTVRASSSKPDRTSPVERPVAGPGASRPRYTKLPDTSPTSCARPPRRSTERGREPLRHRPWRCSTSSSPASSSTTPHAAPTTNDPLTELPDQPTRLLPAVRRRPSPSWRARCSCPPASSSASSRATGTPGRQLVGVLARHPRLARGLLRGRRLGPLRAHAADGDAGITHPVVHRPGRNDPGGERQDADPTGSPGAQPSAGDRQRPPRRCRAREQRDRDRASAPAAPGRGFPWVWVLVPLAVIAVLLLPWAVRLRQRRRRLARTTAPDPRDAAAAAWTELAATCADLDLAWPASRTPRQVALHLIEHRRLEPVGSERSAGSTSPRRDRRRPTRCDASP